MVGKLDAFDAEARAFAKRVGNGRVNDIELNRRGNELLIMLSVT